SFSDPRWSHGPRQIPGQLGRTIWLGQRSLPLGSLASRRRGGVAGTGVEAPHKRRAAGRTVPQKEPGLPSMPVPGLIRASPKTESGRDRPILQRPTPAAPTPATRPIPSTPPPPPRPPQPAPPPPAPAPSPSSPARSPP